MSSSGRGLRCGLLLVVALSLLAPSALAYPPPGHTTRVSVGPDGVELDGQSGRVDISADGRYLVFGSRASNASELDGLYQDVYLADRATGELELVSLGYDRSPALGESQLPRMSDDGGVVAFSSRAPNLVEGDTNEANDAFYWIRETGEIGRASVTTEGAEFDSSSQNVEISGDGRFVTFSSRATNAVENPNAERLIFVHEIATGITESATHTHDGSAPAGPSFFSVLSADGRYVGYESFANNIVADDGNPFTDCFVYDRVTGETQLVSLDHTGGSAGRPVSNMSISGDGRVVAFQSDEALVPDVQGVLDLDIYVRELDTGEVDRVSVTSKAFDPNGSSTTVQLGHDGRFVIFSSRAVDLTPEDTNGNLYDAFVHDRRFGTTELLSRSLAGGTGNHLSFVTGLSHDARFAAVYSVASDLVAGDRNEEGDSFVRDRGPRTGPFDLRVEGDDTLHVSGSARLGPQRLATAGHPSLPAPDVDLVGADISLRPEEEDVYLRLDAASMRNIRGAIAPGMLFGFDLETADGRSLQIRAQGRRVAIPADIGLFDCTADCTRIATLEGGVGVTGSEVVASLPLALIDGVRAITSSSAWITLGDQAVGPVHRIEEVDLGAFELPETTAGAAIVPAGTAPADVRFSTPLDLTAGRLAATLDAAALGAGVYDVWARVCVGDACGVDVTSIVVGSDPAELEDTSLTVSVAKDRGDVVVTALLLDAAGMPLEGRQIAFALEGDPIGTAVTDATGAASLSLHRNVVRRGGMLTATFSGDETYSSSLAQTEI